MYDYLTDKQSWIEIESAGQGTAWVNVEDIIQHTDIHHAHDVHSAKLVQGYGVQIGTQWEVFKTLREARKYVGDPES